MKKTVHPILSEIEAFLSASGMGESYFGRVAAGNTELVSRLRAGGDVHMKTAERVREFIAQRQDCHSRSAPQ